jgi:hypothetical protein
MEHQKKKEILKPLNEKLINNFVQILIVCLTALFKAGFD